jgi:hypothetical protein
MFRYPRASAVDARKTAIEHELRTLADFRGGEMAAGPRLHGKGQCRVPHKLHLEARIRSVSRGGLATLLRADAGYKHFLDTVAAEPAFEGDAAGCFAVQG